MNDIKLGEILKGTRDRDAIHIAVAPVQAGESLKPAQRVCLVDGKAWGNRVEPPIGIVDPFLQTDVARGQIFWLCIFQGTITALRHEWTHPAFAAQEGPAVGTIASAVEVLKSFASDINCTYKDLMSRLDMYADNERGDNDHVYDGLNSIESHKLGVMWDAYEIVRGTKVEKSIRNETHFRCKC